MIYQAEKMISENEEKIPEEDRAAVRSAVEEAKKDLESGDAARMDAAQQRLEQSLHKVAEALYKAENAEGAPPESDGGADGAGDSGSKDDDVVDAEYTEEKGDS
jgi:molecular chaperone DnaK